MDGGWSGLDARVQRYLRDGLPAWTGPDGWTTFRKPDGREAHVHPDVLARNEGGRRRAIPPPGMADSRPPWATPEPVQAVPPEERPAARLPLPEPMRPRATDLGDLFGSPVPASSSPSPRRAPAAPRAARRDLSDLGL